MKLIDSSVLVTGGAGFIGSHLVERLTSDNTVTVVDNLSNSRRESVPDDAKFINANLFDKNAVNSVVDSEFDIVFHFAARKDSNDGDPRGQFEANTAMTYNLLSACRSAGIDKFAYSSSSTIYGEAPRPTPEDYAPIEPIGVYGASKLADEGLLSTYAHSYGITVFNFRFANVIGPRLRGAVIPDFIEKLRANPETLTILGDGRQEKSYLHLSDCLDAMCHVVEKADQAAPERSIHTFNLGTRTTTSVDRIAEIVADVLGVSPEFEYTGGERGWTGDVPRMRLSIEKLSGLGWQPNLQSTDAVRKATEELTTEI